MLKMLSPLCVRSLYVQMSITFRPAVARPAPEAVARFERGMGLLQEGALLVAGALAEIHRVAAYRIESCSSVYEWAERRKLSAAMARTLVSLHHAMELSEPLAKQVEERAVTIDAAAALEKIVRNPALTRPGEDWIAFATTATTRDVMKKVL